MGFWVPQSVGRVHGEIAQNSLRKSQGTTSEEQQARIFHRKMFSGDLRGAVRFMTDWEQVGVYDPQDIDLKSGDTVAEVLASKHPEARVPDLATLHHFDNTPEFVDVDITTDTVEKVACRLSGSVGVGGIDSHAVQHWLIHFRGVSERLRLTVARFSDWLSNSIPPWATYRVSQRPPRAKAPRRSRKLADRGFGWLGMAAPEEPRDLLARCRARPWASELTGTGFSLATLARSVLER